MQTLSDIAVFAEVVERGSFTAAADALDLSKAAVSKYVSRLEKRLGTRLLQRTTRRLTLTEAGTTLYVGVSGPIEQIAAAGDAVLELAGEPRGRLRVSAPTYFGAAFLVPLFGRFMNRYPHVELDLHLDNRLVDLVKERFDLAIRITTLTSSSMVARRLASANMVTVASPAYLQRAGRPATPQELRDHACLTYTLDRTPNEWHYVNADGTPNSVRVGGGMRCNSDEALKAGALHGLGVVRFLEQFVTDELAGGELVRLLGSYEPPPNAVCAVFPTRSNLAPKVRVFVDFVADSLRDTVPPP